MIELTSAGLVTQTTAEIRTEIQESLRGGYGVNVGTSDDEALGILAGILAEREDLVQQATLASSQAWDPDSAEDAAQDAICAITGTVRKVAASSTVTLTATGTNGTLLPTGRQVTVDGTGEVFATTAPATIATLTSWVAATSYAVGARRTNAARCYVCITAGTSAGSGGPTTTADDITDGSVHWRYMGEGAAAIDVAAASANTGPIAAASGTIVTIATPIGGWTSVINLLDATPGTNREPPATLRVRRELELFTQADAVLGAIYSALRRVEDVTAVQVYQNTSIATVDGVPGKAVEAIVVGGEDQDIIDALFGSVAAGIETYGTETGVAVDPNGDSQTVKFSRPVEVDVYLDISVTVDGKVFPVNGAELITAAVIAAGDLYGMGKDVTASAIVAMVFGACDGVLDVTEVLLDDSASPATSATIGISMRQRAVFDTSRVDVTVTLGVP